MFHEKAGLKTIAPAGVRPGKTRYLMLFLIFFATVINYVDRTNLAVVAPILSEDLGLDRIQMGLLFSAFAWTYAFANLPGGFIVDRLGSRVAYGWSLFLWSAATFVQGAVSGFAALFGLRLLVGAAEAPAFPSNNRVVTMWFPKSERGSATSFYVVGQYIGTAMFTPLLFWVAVTYGWREVFYLTGGLGIIFAFIWFKVYRDPKECKRVSKEELRYIEEGGALTGGVQQADFKWSLVWQLFEHRQIWAICIGKFAISSTLFFFLTWFPTYLVEERGMTMLKAGFFAVMPYIAASVGVLLGGYWSDTLLKRGYSMSVARKLPIVTGFVFASTIFLANFTESNLVAISILSFAFFAQGVSSMSWAIISEVAPKELIGVTGGVCNFAGNLAGIIMPITIGFILAYTGSFSWALGLVGIAAITGALSYTFLLGPVKRIELRHE
ncbi:MFS transporter [Cellvibrio sp. KB43]|uniref:MFS transporter n=2 Tax=Cellvibrio polysaccharolyticus TaxID=2082724 RepID=A0A928YU30_9GAMM|nr:MFS transporter [Cellvibrio polysaccharolyticus]